MIKMVFLPLMNASGIGCVLPSGEILHHACKGRPTLHFHRRPDIWRLVISPEITLAELYAENRITITGGDIYDLVHALLAPAVQKVLPFPMRVSAACLGCLQRFSQGWTKGQSRRNVHAHYDLGNELYALFLDEDWQYSCAYFRNSAMTLDEAQRAKKDHIMRKLRLKPGARILDIGSGWGGMALHLARADGIVKGITLSAQQHEQALKLAGKTGLPVTFALQDYREEEAFFDRIVSVGMLEHVGKAQIGKFFQLVDRCLEEDGIALIHTIGRPGHAKPTSRFIQKYIFPGGYIPSLTELTTAVEKTTLAISDVEVLHLHYAETLNAWRKNFLRNKARAIRLFDERFARIWEFYLAASEAAFRHRRLAVYQLQLMKPGAASTRSRAYIYR